MAKRGQTKPKRSKPKRTALKPPAPATGRKLRSMRPDEFLRRLHHGDTEADKCFALFLGAGCSKSSGIPLAGELVRDRWLPRLRNVQAPERTDLDVWAREIIPDYESDNPAASYGELIEQLFLNPEDRQREIEALCEGQSPGFGYAVLARLVSRESGTFNIVLTTNFDDMVADALYLYTDARPLVIHHESLAPYIRPTRTRPLVVKLHGDHRLSPRNTNLETAKLEEKIALQTAMVLNDRGLIFIGYGGNDASIHRLLEGLPDHALPYGAYWVHKEKPTGPIRDWLLERDGIWVQSGYFDELMLLARNEFDLPHPDQERFTRIFDDYQETFRQLSAAIDAKPDTEAGAANLKEAVEKAEKSFPDFWAADIAARRLATKDPDAAEEIYRRGIEQFPDGAPLLYSYAIFLRNVRQDLDRADKFYRRAIEADPKSGVVLGGYANFLRVMRKEHDRAEAFYQRAIEANPKQPHNLGNYATFLTDIRKDHDQAEELFKRAIESDPTQASSVGNYAVFLTDIRKDHDRAEEFYKRAIDAKPGYALGLGNYANFLANIRKDPDQAEQFFKRAIEANPKKAETLANYASFLLGAGRRDEGLDMLDRAFGVLKAESRLDTQSECWFYAFAHRSAERRPEALGQLKHLIVQENARSPYWDFTAHIERATADGHPDAEWLPKLAAVINDEADPKTLDAWPAWAAVEPRT